ncbi:hypothetical protein pCPXV0112 [Camelpox virus]|uniref:CMP126.5Rc n=1 Tax=Camelpox virus (strain CMS) TaxID=203172 RepID=Q8QQ35_CAMPS|nr:CMP126.5Rc [Camelpox virus CMS]UEC93228.1 hypothetical protein pCPXV0112 [Camelpox virus]UEC93456.1 hypothetical protein pCPXV0112 [Camelpox virus]UEC93685.1 hypothetical protein pCPXV0112 [Camelpox virus]UEC93914.1 hypothetical protein pCPXV0112 [Camelpox virus]
MKYDVIVYWYIWKEFYQSRNKRLISHRNTKVNNLIIEDYSVTIVINWYSIIIIDKVLFIHDVMFICWHSSEIDVW